MTDRTTFGNDGIFDGMKRIFFVTTALVLVLGADPAMAGFQWFPPAPVAVSKPAEVQSRTTDPALGPVIEWNKSDMREPIEKTPLTPEVKAMPAPVPVLTDKSGDPGAVVEGFGDGVTLVMAMRDIAPPEYQFSFGREVDLSAPADWQGGRPWKEVMSGLLEQQGLKAAIYGQMIVVSRSHDAPSLPLPGVSASSDVMAMAPVTEPAAVASATAGRDRFGATDHASMIAAMTRAPGVASSPAAQPPVPLASSPAMQNIRVSKPEVEQVPVTPVPVVRNAPVLAPAPAPVVVAEPVASSSSVSRAEIVWQAAPAVASSSAMAKPEMSPSVVTQEWRAEKNAYLRDVLKDWSTRAGVKLVWSSDYDYRLPADRSYGGRFEEAVASLLDGFSKTRPQPYGRLHRASGDGAPALVIKTY